jgi:ATP-dependent Lon protease
MEKSDVEKIVNDEIKKFVNDSLDKEMKRILRSSNSHTRDEMISTIKNAMEAVVRVLWQKKDFWKTDIK